MTKATEQKKDNPTQVKDVEEGQVPPHLVLKGWPAWLEFERLLKEYIRRQSEG